MNIQCGHIMLQVHPRGRIRLLERKEKAPDGTTIMTTNTTMLLYCRNQAMKTLPDGPIKASLVHDLHTAKRADHAIEDNAYLLQKYGKASENKNKNMK
mmetsp:Transcript_25600/g.31483  ORF Transcript_25600/g.31483 Transcript_25600/m.31483 type:complete len:98 (+) Transcript_25600:230-523(+)